MMRHVEMLPNKDLAQGFPRNIAYIILLSGLWICFIQCGEVRLNCSNETRLRSIFGENAVCEKERCTDPCSFLEPSCLKRLIGALVFHSPTQFFLCACELHLKRVLTFHKCVANVFVFAAGWNFWYADPKGEDMRNIGEVFCCPSLVPCNPMKTYCQIQPSEKDMEERKSEMKRLWVPNLDPRWCKKKVPFENLCICY